MICSLGSILTVITLELSIKVSSNTLIEACMSCTKLLNKVFVEQCLEALVYVYDKAHVY